MQQKRFLLEDLHEHKLNIQQAYCISYNGLFVHNKTLYC